MKTIYLAYGLPGQAMADEIMRKEGTVYEDDGKDSRIILAEACDGIDIVKLEITDDSDPNEIADDYAGEWAWTQPALERLLHSPKDFVSDGDRR